MALKLVVILAVACAAQAMRAYMPTGRSSFVKRDASDIETDLIETFQNVDDIREIVNVMALEASNRGQDPKVIIACFLAQKDLYFSIGKRINELMIQASNELANDLGDKYEAFYEKISVPMNNIATLMRTVPQKMLELIKKLEFAQAMELMRETRKVFEENARMIASAVRELRAEMPQVVEKAEQWAVKIREESRKGMQTLRQSFEQCVKEGGPKKSADSE